MRPCDQEQEAPSAVLSAYEKRLAALEAQKVRTAEIAAHSGRPVRGFDESTRTALEFLETLMKIWRYGYLAEKRGVLRIAFASHLSNHRNDGFRTAEKAIPFLIFNDLEGPDSEESGMVQKRDRDVRTSRYITMFCFPDSVIRYRQKYRFALWLGPQ